MNKEQREIKVRANRIVAMFKEVRSLQDKYDIPPWPDCDVYYRVYMVSEAMKTISRKKQT